jgi:hypothetical protein
VRKKFPFTVRKKFAVYGAKKFAVYGAEKVAVYGAEKFLLHKGSQPKPFLRQSSTLPVALKCFDTPDRRTLNVLKMAIKANYLSK